MNESAHVRFWPIADIGDCSPDHIGNVEMFPQSLLVVRRPEYEWPNPLGVGRFKSEHPAKKLEDDYLRLNARVIVNHFI